METPHSQVTCTHMPVTGIKTHHSFSIILNNDPVAFQGNFQFLPRTPFQLVNVLFRKRHSVGGTSRYFGQTADVPLRNFSSCHGMKINIVVKTVINNVINLQNIFKTLIKNMLIIISHVITCQLRPVLLYINAFPGAIYSIQPGTWLDRDQAMREKINY